MPNPNKPIFGKPARPMTCDPDVIAAAVERLLPEVIEWLAGDFREAERAGYVTDLTACLSGRWITDGYGFAKYLDSHCHWMVNAKLVDILDNNALDYLSDAHDQLVRHWVAALGIKPALEIGAWVDCDISAPREHRGRHRGQIIAIRTDVAEYAVTVPTAGQTYDAATGLGSYYLFTYEDLEGMQRRLDQDVAAVVD